MVITGYQHSSKYYFVFSRRNEFIQVWRLGQLEGAVNVDWIFIFGWAISLSHFMRYLVCEIHTFLAWISVQIYYGLLYTDIITFSNLTHYQIFIGFILKGQLPSSNESDLGEDVALHYFLQQRTSGLTWSAENEARSVLLPVILLHRVQIHSAKKKWLHTQPFESRSITMTVQNLHRCTVINRCISKNCFMTLKAEKLTEPHSNLRTSVYW